MKLHNRSIVQRVVLCLCLYAGALFLMLWIFQIELLPSVYQNYHKRKVLDQISSLEQRIDEPGFYKSLITLALENTACIRLLREDGTELFSLDYMPFCGVHTMAKLELFELWESAEKNGGRESVIYNQDSDQFRRQVPSGTIAILHTQEFLRQDGSRLFICYNSVISPINNVMEVLQHELWWIIILFAGLSLIIALGVGRMIARPITKIISQAKRLRAQDYAVNFDSSGYREVAELSILLNETSRTLELLEKMRREMIANMSHDLRTPLSMIIAYSEVMRDIPEENTPENVQVIIDEAKRLTNLVNEALLYPESTDLIQMKPRYSRFDFAGLCQSIVERYHRFGKGNSSVLTYEGPQQTPVLADRTKLEQVLYNLIDNAFSHSESSTRIILRIKLQSRDVLRVEVEDNGKGIPREKQRMIWKLNYSDSSEPQSHSGLGLSIVQTILEQHHAQYGVVSEPGVGSTFWFTFDPFSRS